jgi:hypothetical protein
MGKIPGSAVEEPRFSGNQSLTTGPLQFHELSVSADGKKLFVTGGQRRGELVRYDNKIGQFAPYLGGMLAPEVDVSRDRQMVNIRSFS